MKCKSNPKRRRHNLIAVIASSAFTALLVAASFGWIPALKLRDMATGSLLAPSAMASTPLKPWFAGKPVDVRVIGLEGKPPLSMRCDGLPQGLELTALPDGTFWIHGTPETTGTAACNLVDADGRVLPADKVAVGQH